ncbi:hamartin isoform X2 [Neocloeon triangulifer]|uniref:hamartin isoform X2 n=1 Tax=Neocloeon triangulifer TaxID=2078957 RepID=UPI00286F2C15|nr:hamartin isoform X2 [Neocloeon triangulifer]
MDVAQASALFKRLESHEPLVVDEAKQTFHMFFNKTKDSWLVNGMFDYYLNTNSNRVIDVLVGVREPHDMYLFERLADSLKGPNKLQGVTLLGYIVRKQPFWLYRIAQHPLLKELLKLLKIETEIVLMMSALLVLIILLPIIPGYVKPVLPDIFEILSRLASWKSNQAKLSDEHLNHLQIGLYFLFQRLYGMFPCSTFHFLKVHYCKKENLGIFKHTIKPMLETVRFHTLLVTANPESETMQERWMNKGHHDVIMECAEFALERLHAPLNRETDGATQVLARQHEQPHKILEEHLISSFASPVSALSQQSELWSPSLSCGFETPPASKISQPHTPINHNMSYNIGYGQDGSSPPEAGVEATPENTPVKDMIPLPKKMTSSGSTAVRAINLLANKPNLSHSTSPNQSIPVSPLRKEPSPFHFAVEEKVTSTVFQKVLSERQNSSEGPKKNGVASLEDHLALSRTAPVVELLSHEHNNAKDFNESGEYEECQYTQGSPCTSEGLHMPNSQSLINFTRKVRSQARMRYSSLCSPFPVLSAGTSPSEGPLFPLPSKMRRISSCPNMKRLDEKDEHNNYESDNKVVAVNGKIGGLLPVKECLSLGTQTSLDQWPNQPYEHLIPVIHPINNQDVSFKSQGICPYELLEESISIAITDHSMLQQKYENRKELTESEMSEVKSLRLQLKLTFLQLQFERYRREVHAERNRRLAGKSRSSRALEEHNVALKEQINLLQKDIDRLQTELDAKRKKIEQMNEEHADNTNFWQTKFSSLDKENQALQLASKSLQHQLTQQNMHIDEIKKSVEKAHATIFDLNSELKNLQESASTSERLLSQLSQLQRQTVLMGETFMRHKKQLEKFPIIVQREEEAVRLDESCKKEISSAKLMLEARSSNLEALKARVLDLETANGRKENHISEQKRLLKATKEEAASNQEAVENKYHLLRSLNQKFEEEILALAEKVENYEIQLEESRAKLLKEKSGKSSAPSPLVETRTISSSLASSSVTTTTVDILDLHSLVDSRPGHPTPSPASPLLRATRQDLAATNSTASQRN